MHSTPCCITCLLYPMHHFRRTPGAQLPSAAKNGYLEPGCSTTSLHLLFFTIAFPRFPPQHDYVYIRQAGRCSSKLCKFEEEVQYRRRSDKSETGGICTCRHLNLFAWIPASYPGALHCFIQWRRSHQLEFLLLFVVFCSAGKRHSVLDTVLCIICICSVVCRASLEWLQALGIE